MTNKKIFCNVPWTNVHVYWDGSYGACCFERHPVHDDPVHYNIKNMRLSDWYNSKPMIRIRQEIKGDAPVSICAGCYHEEAHGYESRRIKENFKSVIFTEQAFERSYQQSPYIDKFENTDNISDVLPVDWHIDLGNECNLACKMCIPSASSKISALYDKWGMQETSANNNWTQDDQAWENFKQDVIAVKNLNRIHFMGGEPLLNKRFIPMLYFFLEHKPDLSLSFVTNGTYITDELIAVLKKFRSCDVELSIESIHSNNDYIRQGTDTKHTLAMIKKLNDASTDTFKVVLRSVPQLLNVNNYDEYIQFAWDNKISIQGVPLTRPTHLQICVLPVSIRKSLIPKYQRLSDMFASEQTFTTITTGRNVGALAQQLKREADAIIEMLNAPDPINADQLRQQLGRWLMRWDNEFNLNARDYYPEYNDFLDSIGYNVQH